MTLTTKIIRIGNSQGIRIPKTILEQMDSAELVELRIEDGVLIVIPVDNPRHGWDKAFAQMVAIGDDALVIPDNIKNDWDQEVWEW